MAIYAEMLVDLGFPPEVMALGLGGTKNFAGGLPGWQTINEGRFVETFKALVGLN